MVKAIGWIVALVVVAVGLLFYNFGYLPQQDRLFRQQDEIQMWTAEVRNLTDQLQAAEAEPDTAYCVVFTFDELFAGAESFGLTPEGEAVLQECVTGLQQSGGTVEVAGHTDNTTVPKKLQEHFPSNWEYAGAKAAAVARALVGWGIVPNRIRVVSAGEVRPRADNTTPEGRGRNCRVEILVRK